MDELFANLSSHLTAVLEARGYRLVAQDSSGRSFGSFFVQFENLHDALRLVWDGRERWLVLERSPVDSGSRIRAWEDLVYQPCPSPCPQGWIDDAKKHVLDALHEYLSMPTQ